MACKFRVNLAQTDKFIQIWRLVRFCNFVKSCRVADGQLDLVYEFRGLERPYIYHLLHS